MPVSVIVGGQFGSEGKGKTAHFFANYLKAKAVIRVGGPNSGHTIIDDVGHPVIFKQLPTSVLIKGIYAIITSGNYLNVNILLKEIEQSKITNDYLYIDPFAVIIGNEDIEKETLGGLKETIGSTGSGIGAAVSRRINRDKALKFAKDEPSLKKYIKNTKPFIRHLLSENERIIIEGTQGFGLSLLHSDYYPYTTSRDTSASAFVSEAGISPLDVDDIIMVIRTYPIRVGGNSGPLPSEIDWNTVTDKSGSHEKLIELTSVTKKIRRVAEFDAEIVKKSIEVNTPTRVVLNHVDYLDTKCMNGEITEKAYLIINKIESLIDREIDFVGLDRSTLFPKKELSKKFGKANNQILT